MDTEELFLIDSFNNLIDTLLEKAKQYREDFATYDGFSEDVKEVYLQVAEELEIIIEDIAGIK